MYKIKRYVAGVVVVALSLGLSGCSGYGTVSPAAYEYAKALYSITNRQASEPLVMVREQIATAEAAGDLPSREASWLEDIIEQAERGDWEDANARCRRMMEDQLQST